MKNAIARNSPISQKGSSYLREMRRSSGLRSFALHTDFHIRTRGECSRNGAGFMGKIPCSLPRNTIVSCARARALLNRSMYNSRRRVHEDRLSAPDTRGSRRYALR